MATIRVWQAFDTLGVEPPVEGGDRARPVEITVGGQSLEFKFSLAATTTKAVWNGTSDLLTNFEFLWIESDQDIYAELTVDVGNEVGDELWARYIKANQPLCLFEDDGIANYTANFATGTADVIDRLRVRNPGSTAANVRIVLVT